MPERRSFSIRVRHKSWVVVFALLCRLRRWYGDTSEALSLKTKGKLNMTERQDEMKLKPEVAATFDSYPNEFKSKLLELRQLILETAAKIESVGEIEETLKWGEPSYLTPKSKSGSTIRIAWKETNMNQYSIFFKCTANLVPAMKERFPAKFTFGGKRSIDFKLNEKVPKKELKQCIALALTYHRNKNLESTDRWEMVEKIT